MRSPKNVLESLTSKAANKDYHYQRLYRNLYNPAFYLLAYERIQAKPGNMTAGSDGKTIDGMSMKRIEVLIQKLKDFSYQPKPARRTYIPKANGKTRPLGIPSFDDKLVQEVVRMILESIYEPTLYYRVVVIKAPLQGLCYTVRDAVDWCFSPTTRMVSERFQPQPLTLLLIS